MAGCGSASSKTDPSVTTSTGSSPTTAPPAQTSAAPTVPTREQIVSQLGGLQPTEWGLEVSGVVQRAASSQVALTLDACGGPKGSGVDQELIDLLVSTQTPATLFINSRWIDANPQTVDQLIANPLFCIGNHGTKHVPLSASGQAAYGVPGTASIGDAYDEVMGNQERLTALMGEPPRFFRPGTAYYDEVTAQMVRLLGLLPVNFDINMDAGATYPGAQVAAETSAATTGSICIGHFNQPSGGTYEGLAQAIPALKAKGLTFARLDEMTLA